jgi:hypothetical protein
MSENSFSPEQPYEDPHLHQEELFPIEHVQPGTDSYKQLVGHLRTDGSFKTDEQLKNQYMELTDKLVHKMTHGVEVTNPDTGEKELKKPDVVVWLDKSARPLSWLTKAAWPQLAADAKGNVPKMPEFKFVNIDREQWVNKVDPMGTGMMNIDLVDQSIIQSLRSVFVSPTDKKNKIGHHIDEAKTSLDGKTVMIVDEVFASGRTLDIATKFFTRAFPKAAIAGAHWMGGITMRKGAVGNADIPVWYKDDTEFGRGVGNRNEAKSQMSDSMTQRLGGWFLSTILRDDSESRQLRKELKMLANDAAEHKFIFMPSVERDGDDLDERIARYNDMTLDEVIDAKHAQNSKK